MEADLKFLNDGFFLGTKGGPLYAEVIFKDTSQGIIATSYIEAPGRGDDLIAKLEKALQSRANSLKKTIIYQPRPENKGSRALFSRTPGYVKKKEKDQYGNPIYEKRFYPE